MIALEVNPKPKPRMVKSDAWKKRKVVLDYWDYKAELIQAVKDSNCSTDEIFIDGTIEDLVFYIKMPKSWSKKKKLKMLNEPHTQRPDLDNLVKAFKDCLLKEDSLIWKYRSVSKRWSYEGSITIGY